MVGSKGEAWKQSISVRFGARLKFVFLKNLIFLIFFYIFRFFYRGDIKNIF